MKRLHSLDSNQAQLETWHFGATQQFLFELFKGSALLALLCFFQIFQAFAQVKADGMLPYKVSCRKKNKIESIEVIHHDPKTPAECEVRVAYDQVFSSDSPVHIPWKAHYRLGYCEEKALELSASLSEQGWNCRSFPNAR